MKAPPMEIGARFADNRGGVREFAGSLLFFALFT